MKVTTGRAYLTVWSYHHARCEWHMALRVLRGCDNITDARSMYEVVKPNTIIKLYVIKDEAFVKAKSPDCDGGIITSIPTAYLAQCGSIIV